jgi:hypothetical protein
MMALQKPLKTAIGLQTLTYDQAVTQLNTAEGGVFAAASGYIGNQQFFDE